MDIKTKEKTKKQNVFKEIGNSVRESMRNEGGALGNFKLWINIAVVAMGFLFGGCHIIFGSYPLGLALVCAMPVGVWIALLGVVLGSLTIGRSGIIYAMICVLSVFLRIIISGSEKKTSEYENTSPKNKSSNLNNSMEYGGIKGIFDESITLRISSAIISGFVAAIYEMLLEGFSFTTVLFGLSMVVLPAIFTFLFAGAFYHDIGVRDLVFGTKRIFQRAENKKDTIKLSFFKISLLVFVAFIAFSLNKYNIFGINLSFVFAGCITLFASKRFGALYGAVVGFVSGVLVSGLYSAAYALLGVGSGAIFSFGAWYAVALGGALLSIWGAYVSGVRGFLSLFPEYLISLCIVFPMFRYFEREDKPEIKETVKRRATDMVGTMALAYRNRESLFSERIEESLTSLIPVINTFATSELTSEDYTIFAKMIKEVKERSLEKLEMDEELTEKLESVFSELGFQNGIIRAFGDRKKYIISSGEDKDGTRITSPELKRNIEEISGLKFCEPEYYRRDEMVVMECEATKKYKLNGAIATAYGSSGEISGDTAKIFESKDLFAYSVVSDGMGSGKEAEITSRFVVDFLENSVSSGASCATLLHMLNSIVRRREEECSVTLDMFSLDLITGDATFIKSGAASSYIKRKNSLFRIKSETMPLGLIKKVDAERIDANVTVGDYIIMISDGVSEAAEDSPWLVEFLNHQPIDNLEEYANRIIDEAKKNKHGYDDMTAIVLRIDAV